MAKKKRYDITETFQLPSLVTKEVEKKKISPESELKERLPKGKYDIDYVIQLCRMIESMCDKMKFDLRAFEFSLKTSMKELRVSLEMEKEYGSNKGPKTFRCDKCGEIYFTLPDQVNASCPHCVKGRWLTQIEDTSLQ